MSGILYGIGVGVGDPENITLKAVNCIKESDIICLPKKEKSECRAFNIAKNAVPEIEEKETLSFDFEMIKDKDALKTIHREIFETVKKLIEDGKKVAFLTIGDPCVYSTFSYIAGLAKEEGIEVKIISGINSFTASAARLGISLCDGDEELHIISDTKDIKEALKLPGTKVIMKCVRSMPFIKECLSEHEKECAENGKRMEVYAVSECGLSGEKLYFGTEELSDDANYMMTITVKEK